MRMRMRAFSLVVLIASALIVSTADCQVVGNGDYFGPQAAGSDQSLHGLTIRMPGGNPMSSDLLSQRISNGSMNMVQPGMALPEYSPVLMDATALGIGAVGSFPVANHFFLRISVITLMPYMFETGGNIYSNTFSGFLAPIEIGTRIPFIRSRLGSLDYTLYGETSAGLFLGWAAQMNESFLGYSLADSRFGSGGSGYLGIGNSVRLSRFVGLYLNGGMGYIDFFTSSFLPHMSYLVPSAAVGFSFKLTP